MKQINEMIQNLKNIEFSTIIDILVAIAIVIVFGILSSYISKTILKIFKMRTKNKKEISKNALYVSLKIFFKFLGIYIAIIFLKNPLNINEKFIFYVNRIFKIISIILVAQAIANYISKNSVILKKLRENPQLKDNEQAINFAIKILKGIIYVIATFLVITELGYNLNGLAAGLGLSGVIITLAAQNVAKDLFGGAVIFMDKPFKVGDWIQFGEYEGTVEDITFRSTRIRTFENFLVNVPNSVISDSSIINCSGIEKRRYKINLTIEIDTPLEKVRNVEKKIELMLKENENIFDDSIIVKFDKINDNGMNLLIYAYTDAYDYASFLEAKESINYRIMQILEKDGIELAYDTKTVVLKK